MNIDDQLSEIRKTEKLGFVIHWSIEMCISGDSPYVGFITERYNCTIPNHIDQKVHHASFVGGIILAECYRIEKELNIAHDLYM